MPTDSVQEFERFCESAKQLQAFADNEEDLDTINFLTIELNEVAQRGASVGIVGGLVEVVAIDEEMQITKTFVPSNDEISGIYKGLSWRKEEIEFPDGSSETIWRICHMIGSQGPVTYIDDNGDMLTVTNINHVTVEGSNFELLSETKSHDFRRIALDAVCLYIDQFMFDDDTILNDKANAVAKFFSKTNESLNNQEEIRRLKQRISYLNHTEMFTGAFVTSKIGSQQTEDGLNVFVVSDGFIAGTVDHVSIGRRIGTDGEFIGDNTCLTFEVVHPQLGLISLPHIPDETTVYATKNR